MWVLVGNGTNYVTNIEYTYIKIYRVNLQCSEICGVLHSAMPIAIEAVSVEKYLAWLDVQS